MSYNSKHTGQDVDKAVELVLQNSDKWGSGLLNIETINVDDSSGDVPVEAITLDYSNLALSVGDTTQLAAAVTPSNATNTAITWETSDSSIATVENGLVAAIASGDCTITARSAENASIVATCAVTVAAESGSGSGTDTSKVQLATLDIVDGSCINKSGNVVAINNNAHYVAIPYSDGMFVSTGQNSSWTGSYPPFVVANTDGTYSVPEYSKEDTATNCGGAVNSYKMTSTLTGYAAEKVYVNMHYLTGFDITSVDIFYFIPGGAE